jgi:hypothetical protein
MKIAKVVPTTDKNKAQPKLSRLMANEANARALADLLANETAEDRIRLALAVRYGGK